MNVRLPASWFFQQQCGHVNGWADHYGALQIAAQYAGLEMPPNYAMRGMWQHGVSQIWTKQAPSALVSNLETSANPPFLVARDDERECLEKNGYAGVRAIGLPFLYVTTPVVPRTPNSLLVVPTHTLVGAEFPDRTDFVAYADEVVRMARGFEHVVICIHPNCRKNGLWVDEFTNRGFQIVYGAQTNDRNALVRMKSLFEQFEFVTTNGWGSHGQYALACGAKVSICGTEPTQRAENLLRDDTWKKNVDALKKMLSPEVQREKLRIIRPFQVAPREGVSNVELGQWYLGAAHRLTPGQMRELLIEVITPTPLPLDPVVGTAAGNFQRNGEDFKSCFALGSHALRTQRLVEARCLFDHAVALDPKNPEAQVGRGINLARAGDIPGAERAFRLALASAPQHVEALRFLAQLCRALRRNEEAFEFYQRLLGLRPRDAEAAAGIAALAPGSTVTV